MEKMKAAILKDAEHFEVVEVDKPVITAPDEIIAKVLVCSICGTDKGMSSNPQSKAYGNLLGRIFGHEFVGEITEIGSGVTQFHVGDRIVVNPNTFCGVCDACRAGYRNHCQNMKLMGITVAGGFAEYVKCTELQAFRISKDVPLDHAAFAEPLSCAMNGFSRLDIHPWETCVVFGCGPIGLLFAQAARKCGARVCCVEPVDSRIAIAEQLGFKVFKPCADLKDKLIAEWGRRANFCILAAPGQLNCAIDAAEFCGKILCFAGPGKPDETWNLGPIQNKELEIKGSFIIKDSMPRAITMLEQGVLDLDPIITHHITLDELDEGMRLMRTGEGMEIIINIGA